MKELTLCIVLILHIPKKDLALAGLLGDNLQAPEISCLISVFVYPETLGHNSLC